MGSNGSPTSGNNQIGPENSQVDNAEQANPPATIAALTTKVQCSSQHSIFTKVGNAAPLGAMQSSGWMGGFVARLAGWLPHKF